jgi:tyrosinase
MGAHAEGVGVVGDLSTALRDPVFYRIHAHVDDLFNLHKEKLTPYTTQELTYDGINVTDFEIHTVEGRINQFNTFFQQSEVNMSKGLDFQLDKGNVFARYDQNCSSSIDYSCNPL